MTVEVEVVSVGEMGGRRRRLLLLLLELLLLLVRCGRELRLRLVGRRRVLLLLLGG